MIRRLPKWMWFAACALVGAIAGIAWPPPPIPKSLQQETAWSLPTEAELARFSSDAFKRASAGLRWDGAGADATEQKRTWRLAGFLGTPEAVALIQTDDAPRKALQVRPGETLPDGSRLVGIERDTISIESGDCQQTLQLYRKTPIRTSPGCGTSADDTETRKSP